MRYVSTFFALMLTATTNTTYAAQAALEDTAYFLECTDGTIQTTEAIIMHFGYFERGAHFHGGLSQFLASAAADFYARKESLDRNRPVLIASRSSIRLNCSQKIINSLIFYITTQAPSAHQLPSLFAVCSLPELIETLIVLNYLCLPKELFNDWKEEMQRLIETRLDDPKIKRSFLTGQPETLAALETLPLIDGEELVAPYPSSVTISHAQSIQSPVSPVQKLSGHKYSPSGKYSVHVSGENHNVILVQNEQEDAPVCILTDSDEIIKTVFSPDEHLIATVSAHSIINVWNIASKTSLYRLPLSFESSAGSLSADTEAEIFPDIYIAFNYDNTLLAVAASSIRSSTFKPNITIWNIKSQTLIQTMPFHGRIAISFSPDSTIIATLYRTKCKLWDRASGRLIGSLKDTEKIRSVSMSSDNRFVATGSDRTISIWDTTAQKHIFTIAHDEPIDHIHLNPDASSLTFKTKSHAWYKTELPIFTEASSIERYLILRLWDKQQANAQSVKISSTLEPILASLPTGIKKLFENLPIRFRQAEHTPHNQLV